MTNAGVHRARCALSWMTAVALLLLINAEVAVAAGPSLPTSEVAQAHGSVRAGIEALSMQEAKQFYLDCSRAAMRGRLGSGETAVCSIGYEVLLERHFGGDFYALLAWSRSQPQRSDGRSANDRD